MPRGPIGLGGRPEKPKPGSDGAITSNASSSLPPKRSGCANGSMIPSNSEIEPGQPWLTSSGRGSGPLPFSWTKWMPMPPTGAVK